MDQPRYVGLQYMADLLELPKSTVKQDHKRAARRRREGTSLPADMPAPDAPADVSSPSRPKWLKATADAYVRARVARMPRYSSRPLPAIAAQLEEDDDGDDIPGRDRQTGRPPGTGDRPAQDETRNRVETDSAAGGPPVGGPPVDHDNQQPEATLDRPRPTTGLVMVQVSKAERELARKALRHNTLSGSMAGLGLLPLIVDGPRGWSTAMAPDRADDIADALMQAWRDGIVGAYELATRFAEDRHPARRTKRGGWAAGVRTGDRTE